eukprot:2358242-Amphidinium_carterae.1
MQKALWQTFEGSTKGNWDTTLAPDALATRDAVSSSLSSESSKPMGMRSVLVHAELKKKSSRGSEV